MRVAANGLEIELVDEGPPDGEPLLLVMGLAMQLIAWPDEFVRELVARGFRVLRFDNRDAGLSTQLDAAGVPNMAWAALRYAMHLPVHAPYNLTDMAADTVGVLDALGLESVHLCGASMGGMIAQHVAAKHPGRVKSLTLMMTTTGARQLPRAQAKVQRVLLSRPTGRDEAVILAHLTRLWNLICSPAYPPAPEHLRERLTRVVRRAWRPAGATRQLLAIVADGDRSELVRSIRAPTRVIHGLADPLLPVEHGRDLAARIPGAVADFIPGMGHDLPLQLLARFADGLAENARRAASAASSPPGPRPPAGGQSSP